MVPPRLVFAALMLTATPSLAQQAEQITVTAPSAGRFNPISTTLLSSADIDRSGASTLGQLLDQLPGFGAQGVNAAQNDGGFGEYFIDLRNLNFDRTLVLVDGKRFVLSGIQTDEAVDLNNIPAAFVDHVEILRDGSQPQYGPDAVAGVVNVVLKDQIEGLHLTSYGAATGHADGGTAEVALTAGTALPGGHAVFGLDLFQHDPVLQSSRAWAAEPIDSASAQGIFYGSSATAGGHALGPGVDNVALGGGRFAPYDPATDIYNPAGARDLVGRLQRATAYADADTALTDSVSADVELLFSDRRATNMSAPQTLGLTGTALHPDGFTIPGTNTYNPFGETVSLARVVTEAGPQQITTAGPVWRVLGGLDGTLGDTWTWSAGFDHGQSLSHFTADDQINLTRALQTAGNGPCPASQGCVPANWFGPDSLSPAAIDYIRYTARAQSDYAETVAQARLSGGLFWLPGGAARLTLGVEARNEYGATTVDAVTAAANQAGPDAAPTHGGYNSYDSYAQLALPVLRDSPWAKTLSATLAARESATTRYGDLPSLRAAIDYSPLAGLSLRAVSGTARRPPAISEAFGGEQAAPQPVTDPCAGNGGLRANPVVAANCTAQGLGPGFTQASPLIDVISGGNRALRAEKSENETLGLSLAPPALPWLSASLDYYQVRIRDAIDSLEDTDPNLIPDLCYQAAHLTSPFCRFISRIPGGGQQGQISNILGLDMNAGTIKTNGLDISLGFAPAPTRYGQFHATLQLTELLNYRLHTTGVAGSVQYAGTFPGLNAVGLYARRRGRLVAGWQAGGWGIEATTRLISGGHVLGAAQGAPYTRAPAVLYQDVEISRRWARWAARLGVDNATDRRPPLLVDGVTNTDTNTYDVLGRVFWARLSYDF